MEAIDIAYVPSDTSASGAYVPGQCNIGADEIARRQRSGEVALAAALISFVGLVAIGAPRPVRLLVGLPAAAAASGYLQAKLRFCMGFGSRGMFNFGSVGSTEQVVDPLARAQDRARVRQMTVTSAAVGIATAVVAATLPL